MKTICLIIGLGFCSFSFGQGIGPGLAEAMKALEKDEQCKHAIMGLSVVDAFTGEVVFEKNGETGLVPASCQKVITSVTAFELLGKDFKYTTYIGKDYPKTDQYDAGCLFVTGSGDPTLGSWRWPETRDSSVFKKIAASLDRQKLRNFGEDLVIEDYQYGLLPLPEGWIWQDIGNYYGAACFGLNWHENQYDLVLQPGEKPGYPAEIITVKPFLYDVIIKNTIATGKPGSGDNGYIYSSPYSGLVFTKGTVQQQAGPFTISGSMPNPSNVFRNSLMDYLVKHHITFKGSALSGTESMIHDRPVHKATHIIDSIQSPPLDSMNYWFLKKSINLYGEALLKSIGVKQTGFSSGNDVYENALSSLKDFWKARGVDPASLNIMDGSGLSPANRVTVNALVSVMQYARTRNWFPSFFNALPEMNGIKMKDGYISGVRSFTGYVKSKSGKEYCFAFMVNNFSGSPGTVREKMWKLLDILK